MSNESRYESAKAELGKHATLGDAAGALGVSLDSLRHLFRSNGDRASTYLRNHPLCGVTTDTSLKYEVPTRDALLASVVMACKRGPVSFEDLCNRLDLSPSKLRSALDECREAGYRLEITGDSVAYKAPEFERPLDTTVDVAQVAGGRYVVAAVGDIHFGSLYCKRDYLKDFCAHAYDAGARLFLQVGDMLDGCYTFGTWELSHHGWEQQAQDAFESLPKMPGARWLFIDGNHDETFSLKVGMLSGAQLVEYFKARGRDDLRYLGPRGAMVNLVMGNGRYPVRVELWHPRKSLGYALTYQSQNKVRDYSPGQKPQLLLIGHWHSFSYFEQRGVHVVACGTFQGQGSAFSKSLGGHVSLGSQIVGWDVTESGTMRNVSVERSQYYDHEPAEEVQG